MYNPHQAQQAQQQQNQVPQMLAASAAVNNPYWIQQRYNAFNLPQNMPQQPQVANYYNFGEMCNSQEQAS